jgi:hypothetical protein
VLGLEDSDQALSDLAGEAIFSERLADRRLSFAHSQSSLIASRRGSCYPGTLLRAPELVAQLDSCLTQCGVETNTRRRQLGAFCRRELLSMGETCGIRLWEREAIYEEAEAAKALAAGQSRVGVFTTGSNRLRCHRLPDSGDKWALSLSDKFRKGYAERWAASPTVCPHPWGDLASRDGCWVLCPRNVGKRISKLLRCFVQLVIPDPDELQVLWGHAASF